MNYYNEIKEKLIKCEVYEKIKDYAKEQNKVKVYYETGKLLSEAGKEYGKNIIEQYAQKLVSEVGKKYNARTLRRMRQFYDVFENGKWSPMATNLTWTHFQELLSIKDSDAIDYYIKQTITYNWSKRLLREKIKSKEYERLPESTRNKIIENNKDIQKNDLVPDPILIKNNQLDKNISEYALKEMILNNIDGFLSQLGNGFTYVGNEYKIKVSNEYNYIDILLYNIIYHCFVVIELKVTALKKEHIGQIQIYMNYIDKNIKTNIDNDTVGIIICKKNRDYVIEFCSDKRIISREYRFI